MSCLLLFLCTNACFAVEQTVLHPTGGLKSDPAEVQAHLMPTPSASVLSNLPSYQDNTDNFPVPGEQQFNDCTSWAVAYALKTSQEHNNREWNISTNNHHFSPAFLFNGINNGQTNTPTSIESNMNRAVNYGICPETYFPYGSYTVFPSALACAAGSLYPVVSWSSILGINAIKNQLALGNGVVVGLVITDDFRNLNANNPVYNSLTVDNNPEYHTICLIGYDDSLRAFKFINSWGTNWGIDGYGWVHYDVINSSVMNLDGAGIGFVMNSSIFDNYVMGDVDGNNEVTAADARLALTFSSQTTILMYEQQVLADVDGNGSVTAADARLILQYSGQLINKFPIYN